MGTEKNFKKYFKNVPSEQLHILNDFRNIEYNYLGEWKYKTIGKGKPIVLLPGGFMDANMWFYLAQKIESYKLIIPDSYVRQVVFNISEASVKIIEMIHQEGHHKAGFLGISAGGGLLQYILGTYPEIVDFAILSHTGVLDPDRKNQIKKTIRIASLMPEFVLRARLKKMTMQKYLESEWKNFSKAFVKHTAQYFSKKALLSWLKGSVTILENYKIKPWNGSMLILTSNDDKLSNEQSKRLLEQYPRAKIHTFNKGGHHTVFLYPEQYTQAIIKFLKSNNK